MYWTTKSIALLGLCATALTVSGNTAKPQLLRLSAALPCLPDPLHLWERSSTKQRCEFAWRVSDRGGCV